MSKRWFRRLCFGAMAALFAVMAIVSPIAASYYVDITVNNTSSTAYTMLPVSWTVSNSGLVSGGYITASGLDVAFTSGGSSIPSMLVNDRTLFALPISAGLAASARMTTANTPATSMYVIPGYNGYITTADNANLEPGNNFTVEANGYWDTSTAGVYGVQKAGALEMYISAPNTITGRAFTGAGTAYTLGASDTSFNIYGANWTAQTFTTSSTNPITGFTLYVEKSGSPSGNINVSLYATSGSKATGSALATVTVSASTIGSAGDVTFNLATNYTPTASTMYAVVVNVPSGDVSNYIKWYGYNADLVANGEYQASTDSGSTWSSGTSIDLRGSVNTLVAKSVSATSMTSGLHDMKLSANGTTLYLYDGATLKDSISLGGGSVVNNANSWIFMAGNSMPYASLISITKSGTEKLKYQPVTIISGTALIDIDGTQNGVFTFGANPSGITAAAINGLQSSGASTSLPTTAPPNRPEFQKTIPPITDNPLNTAGFFDSVIDPMATIINDSSGNPTLINSAMMWTVLWMLMIEGVLALSLQFLKYQWIGVIVGGMGFLAAWKFGSMPGWAFLLFAITAAGIVWADMKRGQQAV